ncbi:MAG TPA: protein kinase [Umezawaea sp.]|nr:protein kinase [Umezawaea sp.]
MEEQLVPLGSGPVAAVYAVGDRALKVFPGRLDRRTRAKLDKEIAAWRGVPATRVVHGAAEMADGRVAVWAELCPESLAERVRRDGPLPAADVVDVALRLTRALTAAHAAGLVHGGLTPHNVLFRATGEPVLADGGLVARNAFPAEPAAEFAAPETVRDAVRDARADLYGLGAVLYHACTGRAPHPALLGERPDDHVLRVLAAPSPELTRADVPGEVRDLVGALLVKDPAARHLVDLEPDHPSKGRIPVAEAKPLPKGEPGRLGLVVGVVGALALLAAAPFLLLRDDPPPPSSSGPTMSQGTAIDVVEVVDDTERVRLTWSSTPADLDYVVITAPEGKPNTKTAVLREHTTEIPVEPGVRYCFEVQGTDGRQVYLSAPKGIRGATCTR